MGHGRTSRPNQPAPVHERPTCGDQSTATRPAPLSRRPASAHSRTNCAVHVLVGDPATTGAIQDRLRLPLVEADSGALIRNNPLHVLVPQTIKPTSR